MSPADFQKAHLRGMAASPFRGSVTVMMGAADEYTVPDCVLESGDNQAKAEEWGINHVRTLSVQVPKLKADGITPWMPRRPETKDKVRYLGRVYNLVNIEGDDAASAVWVLTGNAPI